MQYSNYTEKWAEQFMTKERNESERRREGAWISRPDTPGLAKPNHKFPNERGAGPTLEHRAQPACQITMTTGMTHNAPHHSLESTDEAGNREVTTASPNDILPSPQAQAVLWQPPKYSTGRTKAKQSSLWLL